MGDMDAYRDVFLAESADYLQQITDGLLVLESDPTDHEPVETVFRGAHSLKGMSAAMGYVRTADLTHKMEGLMDRVRKGELSVTQPVVDLMLAALDLVRDLIEDESAGKSEIESADMIAAIETMTARATRPAAEEAADEASETVHSAGEGEEIWLAKVTLDESCVLKAVRAYMVIKRLAHMGTVIETHPPAREIEDERFDREFEIVLSTASPEAAIREAIVHVSEIADVVVAPYVTTSSAPVATMQPTPVGLTQRRRRDLPKLSQTQTVRVSIGHLDTLVDLVGELIILRSRLEDISAQRLDPELTETIGELQRISTELQYEVMQTRMVPVGNIFNRFPRMVRDLAVDLGKQIDFRMSGLDIELDRTVLDEIGDPLVHLLRNSIDHGIEPADTRVAAGKSPVGTVTLSAARERDHVAITVSDDGRGIDPQKVWKKAVERGLVTEDERQDYEDADILLFTCVPGFSTMDLATKVSGRGVGMDVVKGKIEHLGGTVRITSCVGKGTDFALRLPLTLAIVQALVVEAGGHEFALPLSSVDEVFRADEIRAETIDASPVVVLRDGEVVPMRRLDALLLGADPDRPPEPRSSIVLLQAGTDRVALHVDALVDRLEVVLKPLSNLLRDSKGFSGATILGDGRVMLVIDPRTILTAAEG